MSSSSGESLRDRLTKATLLISIVALLSRVLGFLRDAVIAYKFGLSAPWDAYNTAIQVPDILNYLVAAGTLSSTFVPLFREYWERERHSAAWTFFTLVASLMLVLIVALVLVFEVATRPIILLLFGHGDKPVEWLDQVVRITRIILPAQIFFVVGGLINGVIYSIRGDDKWYVAVPTFGSVIYNIAIITGGLVLSPRLGIEGFAWGGLVGAIVGPFLLVTLAARRAGAHYRFRINLRHRGVHRYILLTLPLMLAVGYSFVDQIIATVFGTHLPEGDISALRQAYRLMQVPVGVIGYAAAMAAIGTLAGLAAVGDTRGFRRQIREALARVGGMIFPLTVLMILLAPALVRMLLQYGAFNPEATLRVATLLRWYAIGMYAWSVNYVLARGLYCIQDTLTPAILGTVTTALMIPLSWLLMKPMGANGLALATTLGISLQSLLYYLALRKRLRGLYLPVILRSLRRLALASAGMSIVCWGIQWLLHRIPGQLPGPAFLSSLAPASHSLAGSALEAGILSLVGIPLFTRFALALKEEEAAYLWAKVGGKLQRSMKRFLPRR
ncbi:MAG TPA: murein biosynthesis integral membrane protein MurJ [Armatimonadota bacterium]|nr:murein biosynthesis integral membrane protein MurJ [Armatimonadota bacterium]